jgi:DNA-binding CsgD family transcriptional regulator
MEKGKAASEDGVRARRLSAFTPARIWAGLAIACAILWYIYAFRTSRGDPIQFSLSFFWYPRKDVGWLCALVSMSLAGIVWCALPFKGSRNRAGATSTDGAGKIGIGPATVVLAAVCVAGTAIEQFLGEFEITAIVGGLMAGAGLALLAMHEIHLLGSDWRAESLRVKCCVCLATTAAFSLIVLPLGTTVLKVSICILPALMVVCLRKARGATVAGTSKGSDAESPAGMPRDLLRKEYRSHLTVVLFCALGVGLLMGFSGFGSDDIEAFQNIRRLLFANAIGAAVLFALYWVVTKNNPYGAYVLLPMLLGSDALLFLLPAVTTIPAGSVVLLACNCMADQLTFLLVYSCLVEGTMLRMADDRASRRGQVVVPLSAALLLLGIILGGVLVSTIGRGTASMVIVAIVLVYGALLGLGLSVGNSGRRAHVVVSAPEDMERIAQLQADALSGSVGNLSPREREVLSLLLQHKSIDAIAEDLCISRNTVKSHIAHIYNKTGVNTRQQLIDLAAGLPINIG